MTTMFIRNLYAKCKMHGSGDAQVVRDFRDTNYTHDKTGYSAWSR